MSARVLVVDDVAVNLRLMEVRLRAEYFDVVLASNGPDAIEICRSQAIDLVLLDVMMPGMDGNEVCRQLKRDARTRHIPVVLLTALDQPADRVRGLEAGADDFLTKPVRDLPLFSRIRSLTRLKMLTDELRVRTHTAYEIVSADTSSPDARGTEGTIHVVADRLADAERIGRMLRGEHRIHVVNDSRETVAAAERAAADLVILDLDATGFDALRLCSALRSNETTRQIPILLVADDHDESRIAKALELGANDYVRRPVDPNEILARTRTQVRRRRQDESLRRSLRETIELATVDPLTGLFNRRFLDGHLATAIQHAHEARKPLALLVADIDHFKRINDTHGHDGGDAVLQQFGARIGAILRGSDTASRIGGEEFVVVMPDTDEEAAKLVAERLRAGTENGGFAIGDRSLRVTVSVGYALLRPEDDGSKLLKRADVALYLAKEGGRNRIATVPA